MAKMVSTPRGIQKKKISKRREKVGFWKKVVDYLMSDTYMYAPLVSSKPSASAAKTQISTSSGGSLGYLERAIAATTPTKNAETPRSLSEKDNLTNRVLAGEDGRNSSPIRRHEAVKHMVHFSTHILSNPDQGVDKKKGSRTKKQVLSDFVTTRSKRGY